MHAGYSQVNITPPPGAVMAAFPRKREPMMPRRAEGVHDPLMTRVLALEQDGMVCAICSSDLVFWQTRDVLDIRARAHAACAALSPERVMLCCTHTHHTGENSYLFGSSPGDPWVEELKAKTVGCMLEAVRDLSPADMAFSQRPAPFNHNRRVCGNGTVSMIYDRGPETVGPADSTLSVVVFCRPGRDRLVWLNWTGHALTVGPDNLLFTADYPGMVCDLLSAQSSTPTRALFTNGCAGNIHPEISMKSGFDATGIIARRLAERAADALAAAVPIPPNSPFSMVSKALILPHRHDPQTRIQVLLAAMVLGPLRIGFLPGEPFVEFQMAFRDSLQPAPTFVVGYANGGTGYLPTRKAFQEGGYGADYFPDPVPEFGRTQIRPGDGEAILDHLLSLTKELP